MPWSLTIGRFGGTAVRVHITFIIFLAWIGFSAWQSHGSRAARDTILFIALIFACVVLHEFGHIFVARRFGITTPQVTLFPIGGIASMQRIPEKPAQELAVAIAGPLVNLGIAMLLFLALGSVEPNQLARLDDPGVSLLARLATANIFLFLFNLIPAFPMDGGRVLRALLAMKVGRPMATKAAATIGQGLAFVFGFLGLFGNPLLLFIAIFVYVAAAGEAQTTSFHEALHGLRVADAMETRFNAMPIRADLTQAVEMLLATAQNEFPVVDAFGKPVGLVAREDILSALKDHDRTAEIASFMRAPIDSVRSEMAVQAALERLQTPSAALCVTDPDGKLVGLLTRQNIADMMMIKAVRPDWRFGRG
jgi:Zn-dependent protease/CBS domain-containing protein